MNKPKCDPTDKRPHAWVRIRNMLGQRVLRCRRCGESGGIEPYTMG